MVAKNYLWHMATKPPAKKPKSAEARTAKKPMAPQKKAQSHSWQISDLEINNFKSIKHLDIKPGRVNVFIGKPNAGKSNILEALAFLGMPIEAHNTSQIPHDQIRFTDIRSIFCAQNINEVLSVITNLRSFFLKKNNNYISDTVFTLDTFQTYKKLKDYIFRDSKSSSGIKPTAESNTMLSYTYKLAGNKISGSSLSLLYSNIKKYHFREIPKENNFEFMPTLMPDGSNLATIIKHNSALKEFANDFFKNDGINILFDANDHKFDIMRIMGDSYYRIDFSMAPDTFQRMLYYLAAIESNKKCVLLFEEPESQSYPPYIQMLAERVIDDMDNQYFITTHSPFIVEKMLEHAGTSRDVKIFVTYFEEYQTKVHELTREEIDQILDYNVDLFFNMQAYQK